MQHKKDYDNAPIGFKPVIYKNETIGWATIADDNSNRAVLIGQDRGCIDALLDMPGDERVTFNEKEVRIGFLRATLKGRVIDSYQTYRHFVRDEVEIIRDWKERERA